MILPWEAVRSMLLNTIESLVTRVECPAANNGMAELSFPECTLRDCPTLTELRQVLTIVRTEAKSRLAEACQLEKRVHATEEDFGALRVSCVRID